MHLISSGDNLYIKEIKSLKHKKHRDEKRLFFIEGVRFVEEALNEKANITEVFLSRSFARSKAAGSMLRRLENADCPVFELPDALFGSISDTETPQGILAVLKMRLSRLDAALEEGSFFVVLDSIQDPGNMGTIIRTADAAGADGIVLSKGCVDLYNPKVLRSTMGSIFHVPVYTVENLPGTLAAMKAKGIAVYGAHLKGTESYYALDLRRRTAIVVGNEAKGVSDEAAACADRLVRIPMPGRAESLNASVAAALLLYEVVRQRSLLKG